MPDENPMTVAQYEHIVKVLHNLSDSIRAHPGMDHNFANRLATLADEVAADSARAHPGRTAS